MASRCQQSRAAALMVALAAEALIAVLAAAAVALVAVLAVTALAVACCIGVDSGGDLESWGSRWTLGLAWALGVRAGPVGLGFALL